MLMPLSPPRPAVGGVPSSRANGKKRAYSAGQSQVDCRERLDSFLLASREGAVDQCRTLFGSLASPLEAAPAVLGALRSGGSVHGRALSSASSPSSRSTMAARAAA